MKRVAGYLFQQDGDRRLTYRKSWWGYAAGCVVAAVVILVVLVVLWQWRSGRDFYVGSGRHVRGTPIAPADQTWWQFAQSSICPCIPLVVLLLFAVGFILAGSEEQRNSFLFDRQRDLVFYGSKELCKLSAIVAIRLVQTRRSGTGIFARLNGPKPADDRGREYKS